MAFLNGINFLCQQVISLGGSREELEICPTSCSSWYWKFKNKTILSPLTIVQWLLLSRLLLRFLCFGSCTFQLSTMKNEALVILNQSVSPRGVKQPKCLSRLLGARRSKLPFIHESNAFASWETLAKMSSDPLRLNCFGLHATKALCSMKNDNMKRNVHVEASRRICHLIITEQLRADWGWEEEFLFSNDRAGDSTKWGAVTVCLLFYFKGPPHYQSWSCHAPF